jgi:hypothetical protein
MTDLTVEQMRDVDWHHLSRGCYAIEITAYDLDDNLDECDPDSYRILGYRLYERSVARVTKTGRTIGRDRLKTITMVAEGADRDMLRSYDDRWDVWSILQDLDHHRALFGQLTGHCGICRRALTDPDSKIRGIGPECIKSVPRGAVPGWE